MTIVVGPCVPPPADAWDNRNGYWRMTVAGARVYAHRLAYEAARGPIPTGLTIDHLCRTRCSAWSGVPPRAQPLGEVLVLPDVPARLTTKEAAKLCRVKPGTIRQWVHRGHLDYARFDDGSIRTVRESDLDEDGERQIGDRLFDQLAVAKAEAKTRLHANRDLRLLVRIGAHA